MSRLHVDFDRFAIDLEAAARQAFAEVAARHPEETLNAFALYTDAGAMTVCPASCPRSFVTAKMAEEPDDWRYYQYSPSEWPYEAMGADEPFEALCTTLREYIFSLEEDDLTAFPAFKQRLLDTCVEVQQRLRHSFFADRGDDLLLLVTISDDDEPAQVLRDRVRRLNSPAAADAFDDWAGTWSDD